MRIYGVPWHTAHCHALAMMRHVDVYSIQINPYISWNNRSRNMPHNVKYVSHFDRESHDLSIINFDHCCEGNSLEYDPRKFKLFTALCHSTDGTKRIFLAHTCPLRGDYHGIRDHIGDDLVVCNSGRAAAEWGRKGLRTTSIVHAYPYGLFSPSLKSKYKFAVLSYSFASAKAHRRDLLNLVEKGLSRFGIAVRKLGEDVEVDCFEDYSRVLQESLIYINVSDGPMPRTRTEAILSGAYCISTSGHDFEKIAKDCCDFADTPDEITGLVVSRVMRPILTRAEAVRRSGRLSKILDWVDYCAQWEKLMHSVVDA
jgi:hypothetical protein